MAEPDGRGRDADTPHEIPAEGWKEVAKRVKAEAKGDNLALVAAGVAFYTFLAVPTALVAVISLWSMVADPQTLTDQITDMLSAAPEEVRSFFEEQLTALSGTSTSGLALSAIIGLLAALWTTSSAMKHLITAINIAYDEDESRGFVKLRSLALALTGAAAVFGVLVIGLIAFLPAVIGDWASWARWTLNIARFPVMLLAFMIGLAVLYRYAPDRDEPKWRWVSWGAVIAAILWILASLGFSLYARSFGSYNATYGALAGIVVLLLWLLISYAVVILGAEINAEMEHQTARDTTEGPPEPQGRRGAYVADTIPESEPEPTRHRG